MKYLMSVALVLASGSFAACTKDNASSESVTADSSTDVSEAPSSEPSAKEGWSDVKSGTKEAARGAGEIAKDAGASVVEGTKEVGRDIKAGAKEVAHDVKAATCPVLGNKTTKTYYTKASRSYNTLLTGKAAIAYDNRECFTSEANAREAGFKSSAR